MLLLCSGSCAGCRDASWIGVETWGFYSVGVPLMDKFSGMAPNEVKTG